jgi:4-alpha-glucanotransferase
MRRGGVLVHPSHLPGPYGAGDLASARQLLDWIEEADLSIWQFLPLGPTDDHGCPYNSPSAFARDTLLLSLDDLVRDGWLRAQELPDAMHSTLPIDFGRLRASRTPLLHLAADRVWQSVDLGGWIDENAWVEDWAAFRALSERHSGRWQDWPEPARERDPAALHEVRETPHWRRAVACQWLFAWQWEQLAREAKRRGIALWGDLPIFVGPESADTWAHRDLFTLDERGLPAVVSGVPPDAFSDLGQLWGHPQYRLDAHRASGHAWWRARFRALLNLCDVVRIDHFRGLAGVWHIPATAPDARSGQWQEGLGAPLLDALAAEASPLPVIAEDLGVITEDVIALREAYDLPGMAVLQFAFGGDDSIHLPHHHRANQVVYTGTHDNDTARGWYESTSPDSRHRLHDLAGLGAGHEVLVRAAWASTANTAIAQLQDLLGLDGKYRTNVPGTTDGNWCWRVPPGTLTPSHARSLARSLAIFDRPPLRDRSRSVSSTDSTEAS